MSKHDPIFEPINIGKVEIKNRIAMAPMNMNYTGPNRYDQAGASLGPEHEPLDRIVIDFALRSVGIPQKRGKADPVLDLHVLDSNRLENLSTHFLPPAYRSGIGLGRNVVWGL